MNSTFERYDSYGALKVIRDHDGNGSITPVTLISNIDRMILNTFMIALKSYRHVHAYSVVSVESKTKLEPYAYSTSNVIGPIHSDLDYISLYWNLNHCFLTYRSRLISMVMNITKSILLI